MYLCVSNISEKVFWMIFFKFWERVLHWAVDYNLRIVPTKLCVLYSFRFLLPRAEPISQKVTKQYWHCFTGIIKLCINMKIQNHLDGHETTDTFRFVWFGGESCRSDWVDQTGFWNGAMLGVGYVILEESPRSCSQKYEGVSILRP